MIMEKNKLRTTLTWHDPSERMPDESCENVLVITTTGNVYFVPYSNKYKAFNFRDDYKDYEIGYAFDDVVAWAYVPVPEELKDRAELMWCFKHEDEYPC